MNFLRTMDLYKAIVLLSLVLLPLGGWLIKGVDERIELSRAAIRNGTQPNGTLEQIGGLQKKVEVVNQNKRTTTDAISQSRTYFEGQILAAAGNSGLKQTEFQPSEPKEEAAVLGSSRQRATDFVIDVNWLRKDPVQMDFVYAVLWNCESGARAVGEQVQQSVWKLRELHLENATDDKLFKAYRTPPAEIADRWTIKQLKFARREPKKGA
jgi:hypothetical protein